MRKMVNDEVPEVLEFLKKDLGKCLYMYIDIMEYGIGGEVQAWCNKNGALRTVVMLYHNSFQIFSIGIEDEKETLSELVLNDKVLMISGEKAIIESIFDVMPEGYEVTSGIIHEIIRFRRYSRPEGFGIAGEDDMHELAELVCTDPGVGGHYLVEDLANQYKERLAKGFGRNYYVRLGGKMLVHVATYAENQELAITSGLVAGKTEGLLGYGSILEGCLFGDLLAEGKRVFTFTTSAIRDKYLKISGAVQCGEYMKLVKKR